MTEDRLSRIEVEVEVKSLARTAVAQAIVVIEGSGTGLEHTFVKIDVSTLPHVAREIPLGSRWRMVLERIDEVAGT
jgi:hypothetical protein